MRFYNPDGALGCRPDDRYFAEKQIEVARLKNWVLETLSTIDATSAVKRAGEQGFEQIQMVQDDKNRLVLFIKPEGKAGYSVYPDKDDLNRFFTTLKQSLDNIDKVRGELARKYYTLAESRLELKVDLFHTTDESVDLNRIQRVAVFKTRNGAILCAPTIDNRRLDPGASPAAVAADVDRRGQERLQAASGGHPLRGCAEQEPFTGTDTR